MVADVRIDRAAGIRFAHERKRVAELCEQQQLETPQHRRLFTACGKLGQRRFVARVQAGMRIFARQELQQQLVQIEPAEKRRSTDPRQSSSPLGAQQRLQLTLAEPRQEQRLKGLQAVRAAPSAGAARPARPSRCGHIRP
jgi:hypothetical protein